VEVAGGVAGQRVGRGDPEVGDDLVVVVQRGLPGRLGGQEEPGVVAAGRTLRRDPVAEVVHAVDGEAQALVGADLGEAPLARVDRLAVGGPPLDADRVVEVDDAAVGVVGEQDAGLLEALADGGHPEGQAPAGDAEPPRRVGVGAALADRFEVGRPVVRVDRAAREDVGPADEVGLEVAPQHEDLDAGLGSGTGRTVAEQQDGGGVTQLHRCRHVRRRSSPGRISGRWTSSGAGPGVVSKPASVPSAGRAVAS
jgi:hypothetical protein